MRNSLRDCAWRARGSIATTCGRTRARTACRRSTNRNRCTVRSFHPPCDRTPSDDTEIGRPEGVRQQLGQQVAIDRIAFRAGAPAEDVALAELRCLVDHLATPPARADRAGADDPAIVDGRV